MRAYFPANYQVKRRKILHIAVVVAKLYFQAASGICSTKKELKNTVFVVGARAGVLSF